MDKNTVIGFILIAVVIIGFGILNQPSAEDIERQKQQRIKDSIEYAQTLQKEQEKLTLDTTLVSKENNVVDDFLHNLFKNRIPLRRQ